MLFASFSAKYRTVFFFFAYVAILIAVGVVTTKLVVHDLVPVDVYQKHCADFGINQHFDNPFERMALFLGKSRITRTDNSCGIEVQAFTLFGIPLGFFRGQPDMKIGIFCSPAGDMGGIQVMRPSSFVDGDTVQGLGIFRDSAVVGVVKKYYSDQLGITFDYPVDYLLFEDDDSAQNYMLTIAPEVQIREAIARIGGGEWPAAIHLYLYHEPTLAVSNIVPFDYLEQWIRLHPQSNFVPADPAQEGVLTRTNIAGLPALAYHVSGLYEYEYVAFIYDKWVVLVSAAEGDGNNGSDFGTILNSIDLGKSTGVSE